MNERQIPSKALALSNVCNVGGSCPAATRLKLDNQMPDTTSRKQTSISPDPSPTCAPEHRARGSHITCRIDACRESAVSSTASLASSPIPSCCPFRGRLLNKSVRERGTAPNTSRSKRRRARAGPSDQSPSAPTPRRCPARRSRNHQGASSFGGPQDRHGVGACGGCWRFGALIWEAQPPGFWICAKFAAQTPTISSNPRRSNVGHDVTPRFFLQLELESDPNEGTDR